MAYNPYLDTEEQHDYEFNCPLCSEQNSISDPDTLSACTHCKAPLPSNAKQAFKIGLAFAVTLFACSLLALWFTTEEISADLVVLSVPLAYYMGRYLYHSRIVVTPILPEQTAPPKVKVVHNKKSRRAKKIGLRSSSAFSDRSHAPCGYAVSTLCALQQEVAWPSMLATQSVARWLPRWSVGASGT